MNRFQVLLFAVSVVFLVVVRGSVPTNFQDDDDFYLQFLNLDEEPGPVEPVSVEPTITTIPTENLPFDVDGPKQVPASEHLDDPQQIVDGWFADFEVEQNKEQEKQEAVSAATAEDSPVESKKRPLVEKELPPIKRQKVETKECLQYLKAEDQTDTVKIITTQSTPLANNIPNSISLFSCFGFVSKPQVTSDSTITNSQNYQQSTASTNDTAVVEDAPTSQLQFVRKLMQEYSFTSLVHNHRIVQKLIQSRYVDLGITGLSGEELNCRFLADVLDELGHPCNTYTQAVQMAINYVKTGQLKVPAKARKMALTTAVQKLSKIVKQQDVMKYDRLSLTTCVAYVLFGMVAQYAPW